MTGGGGGRVWVFRHETGEVCPHEDRTPSRIPDDPETLKQYALGWLHGHESPSAECLCRTGGVSGRWWLCAPWPPGWEVEPWPAMDAEDAPEAPESPAPKARK